MTRRPGHMRMGGSTHRLLMEGARRLGDMHNVPTWMMDAISGPGMMVGTDAYPRTPGDSSRVIGTGLWTGGGGTVHRFPERVREHTKEYADESMHRKVVSMGKKADKRAKAMEMYAPTKD
jgi:hypothetical protein